jgi:site-specific recombinase XerD
MRGADLATVQKLMGHKSIQMTMRYAHLAPDHLKSAVARIDFGTNLAQSSKTIQKSA